MAIRFDFAQSEDKIQVALYVKDASVKSVRVECVSNKIQVHIGSSQDGPAWQGQLWGAVSDVNFETTPFKIQIELKKTTEKQHWPCLLAPLPTTDTKSDMKTVAPTSYAKWDTLDKHPDLESDGKDINDFFKRIYADSDDAARRAMNKSYSTSGGTVLSTNWKEVATATYSPASNPQRT